MPKPTKLTEPEIEAAIREPDLQRWTVRDGKLHREYAFEDFVHAFGFMATSAIAIEAMNHHPDWTNRYNRVTIDLITHDARGLTSRDVDLAKKLEALAQRLGGAG